MEATEAVERGEEMKTGTIHKIFGAQLRGQVELTLVDWYIGPSRSRGLIEFALAALLERGHILMAEVVDTEHEEWLKGRIQEIRSMLESTIDTWQDEEVGPKNEMGTPLSATGVGAKKRYEAYILTWIDQLVRDLENEFESRKAALPQLPVILGIKREDIKEPLRQAPADQWPMQWAWFEEGVNQAETELRGILPVGILDKIRFDLIWNAVVQEVDLKEIRPSICACTLRNDAVLKIVRMYGSTGKQILTPAEELNMYSLLLTCVGGGDVQKTWWGG